MRKRFIGLLSILILGFTLTVPSASAASSSRTSDLAPVAATANSTATSTEYFDVWCDATRSSDGAHISNVIHMTGQFDITSDNLYAKMSNARAYMANGSWSLNLSRWYQADYNNWQSGYVGPYANGTSTPAWNTTKYWGWSPSRARYGQWELRYSSSNGFAGVCTVYAIAA